VYLYGRLCNNLHKLPTDIDEMTLRDVLDVHEYWKEFPPLVEIVSYAVGVERPKKRVATKPTKEDQRAEMRKLQAEIAMINSGNRHGG